MKKSVQIIWLNVPEEHDYPAAFSYLNLIFPSEIAKKYVLDLEKENMTSFKAKDIFRASRLSLLGVSNIHIQENRKKIEKHIALSPLLLVRDRGTSGVIIADGYHRLCAVYKFDEDATIPCKII